MELAQYICFLDEAEIRAGKRLKLNNLQGVVK